MAKYNKNEELLFQREILRIIKKKFPPRYQVNNDEGEGEGLPDIIVKDTDADKPLPQMNFEVYYPVETKFSLIKINENKVKQVKRFTKKISGYTFLVIPNRLSERLGSFTYYKESFFIITKKWLPQFLDYIIKNAEKMRDYFYDEENRFNSFELFNGFLSEVGEVIYKCNFCSSNVFSIHLIYCRSKHEYYHPDYLDTEEEIGKGLFHTYSECDDCPIHIYNLRSCGHYDNTFGFQCSGCGAIFDKKRNVIHNFNEYHMEYLIDIFKYYSKET